VGIIIIIELETEKEWDKEKEYFIFEFHARTRRIHGRSCSGELGSKMEEREKG